MGLAARGHGYGRALSSETFSLNTTTPQALTIPSGAKGALLTAGANPIRFRVDGNNPTSSVGHYLAANANLEIFVNDMIAIRFIAATSTSDCIVTYFADA